MWLQSWERNFIVFVSVWWLNWLCLIGVTQLIVCEWLYVFASNWNGVLVKPSSHNQGKQVTKSNMLSSMILWVSHCVSNLKGKIMVHTVEYTNDYMCIVRFKTNMRFKIVMVYK